MLMPDVTAILNDPEVGGGVAFQVRRVENERSLGSVIRHETVYDCIGNIQPEELSVLASTTEDQLSESIVIWSTFAFNVGINTGGDSFMGEDEVLWDGKVWRVTRVENWKDWGFTVAHAMCTDEIPEDSDDEEPDDKPEEPEEPTNEG